MTTWRNPSRILIVGYTSAELRKNTASGTRGGADTRNHLPWQALARCSSPCRPMSWNWRTLASSVPQHHKTASDRAPSPGPAHHSCPCSSRKAVARLQIQWANATIWLQASGERPAAGAARADSETFAHRAFSRSFGRQRASRCLGKVLHTP